MQRRDIDVICFDEASRLSQRPRRALQDRQEAGGRAQVCLGHDRLADAARPDRRLRTGAADHAEDGCPRSCVQFRHETMVQVSQFAGCRARTPPRRSAKCCSRRCATRWTRSSSCRRDRAHHRGAARQPKQQDVYNALRTTPPRCSRRARSPLPMAAWCSPRCCRRRSAGSMATIDRQDPRARQRPTGSRR